MFSVPPAIALPNDCLFSAPHAISRKVPASNKCSIFIDLIVILNK
jgi:hypothetical protein